MRKFWTIGGAAFLAVALLLSGSPASAGSLSWEDAVDEPDNAAQATLDITKVSLNYDGKTFTVDYDIKQLGEPAPFGTGQYFAFDFVFGETEYLLVVTQDRLVGDNMQFQSAEPAPDGNSRTVTTIMCKTCKFKLDFEASKVHMEIGFESLKSGLRKLAPGAKIEGLVASTGMAYSEPSGMIFTSPTILWNPTPGDDAPHPSDGSFTF